MLKKLCEHEMVKGEMSKEAAAFKEFKTTREKCENLYKMTFVDGFYKSICSTFVIR